MNPQIEHDRHKVKDANEARLKAWINATPVDEVPLNQFGKASRSRICDLLVITRSTVGSNIRIREMFDGLDELLAKAADALPSEKRRATRKARETEYVSKLVARAEEAELKAARLQYLENFGHMPRE